MVLKLFFLKLSVPNNILFRWDNRFLFWCGFILLFPSVIFFIAYLFPLFQVLVFISLILAVRCSFSRICNFLSIYKKCLKIPKGVMRITPWQVCCYPCCFYIDFLIRGLGNDYLLCNPTYTSTTRTKEEIQDNLNSALCSLGISTKDEKLDISSLHCIP